MDEADTLVKEALKALEREDHARAKRALKRAASLAPLRSDIRELLVYTLESEPTPIPDGAEEAEGSSRRRAAIRKKGTSWRLAATLAVVIAGIFGLGVLALSRGERLQGWIERKTEAPRKEIAPTPEDRARTELRDKVESLASRLEFDGAIAAMNELLQGSPPGTELESLRKRMGELFFGRGKERYDRKDYPGAIEDLEKAIGFQGENADFYSWLGQTHFIKGRLGKGSAARLDFAAAEEALRKAVEIDPQMLKNYRILAQTYIAQDRQVKGANEYRKIITLAPGAPEATRARKALESMGMRVD